MAKRQGRFDSGDKFDDPEVFFDGPPPEPPPPLLVPKHNLNLNLTTNMEYWEVTLDRSQKTLPVWNQYLPDLNIGTQGPDALEGFIDGFEPLVQARVAAQDVYDEAFRNVQASLLKMKLLGTKVPVLIGGHLDENERLMKDLRDLFGESPRTADTILKRARELYPVWERANVAMAALSPAQPPITRAIQGVAHTSAMYKALLDGYTDLIKILEDKEELLNSAREALRAHNRQADRLNKRWYRVVKTGMELSPALAAALEGIPTEPSTPEPEPIEIATVTQGGEEGREALTAYVLGGGAHATLKELQFTLPGEPEPFTHKAPLVAAGNALGPFAEGTGLVPAAALRQAGIDPTRRPQTLQLVEIARLADVFHTAKK